MVLKEARAPEVQAPETKAVCIHHWIIETADGPTSLGFCQRCFETKEFKNSIDDWSYDEEPAERRALEPVPQD